MLLYRVSGVVLGSGNIEMNMTDKVACPPVLNFWWMVNKYIMSILRRKMKVKQGKENMCWNRVSGSCIIIIIIIIKVIYLRVRERKSPKAMHCQYRAQCGANS